MKKTELEYMELDSYRMHEIRRILGMDDMSRNDIDAGFTDAEVVAMIRDVADPDWRPAQELI